MSVDKGTAKKTANQTEKNVKFGKGAAGTTTTCICVYILIANKKKFENTVSSELV